MAVVDSLTGRARAVANGGTQIAVNIGDHVGVAALTVAQVPASVQVAPLADSLTALGDTVRMVATARDARGNPITGAGMT